MSAAARLPWRIVLAGTALVVALIAALAVGHAWPGMLSGLLDRVLARIGAMGGAGAVLFALLQIAIAVLGNLAHAGLHAGETGGGPMRWVFLGVGIVATVLLTARVGQLLDRSLRVGALSQS